MAYKPTNAKSQKYIYALDIGTRSVIGMLGVPEGEKVRIVAFEKEQHAQRTMMDGQIEDIERVAQVVQNVTKRLEEKADCKLYRASVAAAGRALRTQKGIAKIDFKTPQTLNTEQINNIEAAAVADAEGHVKEEIGDKTQEMGRFFLVGYTATKLVLDGYQMANLQGHSGQVVQAEVVATFLPSEVIESLYSVLRLCNLQVESITLEPIAALNAAIPPDLRLLNLALVDIGAGTSDIAICREGGVIGYTMATIAGDEITEGIMKNCLVDYLTAERMKTELAGENDIEFTDILGFEKAVSVLELHKIIERDKTLLTNEIASEISKINGGAPSAVFLAGGGSKLANLCEGVAKSLSMDKKRVAIAGGHFKNSAVSDVIDLNDPEYTTPLGIAVSSGLGLLNDSYRIKLNGEPAKLFRNDGVSTLEVLMMNGYSYNDLIGKNGKNLLLDINGKRKVYPGTPSIPSVLLVNGHEAAPSNILHAGDEIEFTPAKPGKDAKITAGQILKDYKAEKILVNGENVPKSKAVPNGAFIETFKSNNKRTKRKKETQNNYALEDEQIETEQITAQGDENKIDIAPKKQEPASEKLKDNEQNETNGDFAKKQSVINENTAKNIPQENSETKKLKSDENKYTNFTLNDAPLKMPQKPDKTPYYLMDLLELSDIDFKSPGKLIEIKVNGEIAEFSTVLKDGDEIIISD